MMKQSLVEDCLNKVANRFELVRIVANRAKFLTKGQKPLVDAKGEKNILISIREVSEGKLYPVKEETLGNDE